MNESELRQMIREEIAQLNEVNTTLMLSFLEKAWDSVKPRVKRKGSYNWEQIGDEIVGVFSQSGRRPDPDNLKKDKRAKEFMYLSMDQQDDFLKKAFGKGDRV